MKKILFVVALSFVLFVEFEKNETQDHSIISDNRTSVFEILVG